MKLDHQAEVLTLDQPVSPALAIGAGIRHQHKSLAESAWQLVAVLSIPHISTGHDKDGHVLDGHLGGWLEACGGRGRVGAVDDLAVKGLHFVEGFRHLVLEDVLYSGAIGDRVAVEEDARGCGEVERGDGAAVVFQRGVEAVDQLGGSYTTI